MTAIEQTTQTFGATSAQSVTAMFGTSAAAESNALEYTNQFTAALQNSEAAVFGADSPWRLAQNPTLAAYDATGDATGIDGLAAEFSGELQGGFITPTTTLTETGAPAFIDPNAFGSQDAKMFDTEFQPYAEGIPGLQLVQLSGVELSALIESGQLQPLNAESTVPSPAGNDLFLFAANGGSPDGTQSVRLLPIAQLEALIVPELSSGLAATNAASSVVAAATGPAVQGAPELMAPGTLVPGTLASSAQNTVAAAVPVAETVQNVATAPVAAALQAAAEPKVTVPTTQPLSNAELASQAPAADTPGASTSKPGNEALTPSLNKTASETFAASKAAEQAAQVKADERAAEGHLVQQNQKAAEQIAKNGKRQAAAQAAQGQSNNSQSAQAASQASAATTVIKPVTAGKDTGIAKASSTPSTPVSSPSETYSTQTTGPIDPRQVQQTAANRVSIPLTWTPERPAGLPEIAVSAEAVAGGLTGLRGEPSFMQSMGLMGGKPSPALSGQITKQMSLQVSKAVKNGSNEFNMRLNPAELGNVRVKMSFTDAGRVSAQFLVERPETLELLQREVRGMERALEAGGHKVAQDGVCFNLDTGDGQSAGKSFADAMQQDRLKEQIEDGQTDQQNATDNEFSEPDNLTDLATLAEILSRVSPDTGLDVRV